MEKHEIVFFVIVGILALAILGTCIAPMFIRVAKDMWAFALT